MVFWNQKKKRTTAKPKTTASISKPKVGSVKQELNIPPQPKKTDIPKPNKVPKNEEILEYRAEVENGFVSCEDNPDGC